MQTPTVLILTTGWRYRLTVVKKSSLGGQETVQGPAFFLLILNDPTSWNSKFNYSNVEKCTLMQTVKVAKMEWFLVLFQDVSHEDSQQ